MGHPWPLFVYFCSFQIIYRKILQTSVGFELGMMERKASKLATSLDPILEHCVFNASFGLILIEVSP